MDHERFVHDWLTVATEAAFLPYEVIEPVPSGTSLAGFGGGSTGRLHCELVHIIDGDEIFIGTIVGDHPSVDDETRNRHTVLGAVQSVLERGVTLPFTLHLSFEERAVDIVVDGVPVTFRGIVGSELDGWALGADIDHRTSVAISGPTGSSVPTAIRRRRDLRIDGLFPGT